MSVLAQLFNELNDKIDYCNWKSIDKMDEVYESTSDIDILIAHKDRHNFRKIVENFGAINVKPRLWMTYPSMQDYILYDFDSGKIFHLHVHYKLIMGSKNAKEYLIPLEDLYLSTRIKHNKYDTYIVKPEIDFLMLILRYAVKYNTSTIQKHKKNPNKNSEVKESKYLIEQCNTDELLYYAKLIDNTLRLNGILPAFIERKQYENISKFTTELKIIRKRLKYYRRADKWEVVFMRKIRDFLNKYYSYYDKNRAKHPIEGGLSVAIVGCDGSGKTTVANTIVKDIRSKLSINKYYLGFNPQTYTLKTRGIVFGSLILRSFISIFRNSFGKKINLYGQILYDYAGLLERKSTYDKALMHKANGVITVFERFPMEGAMDNPTLHLRKTDLDIVRNTPSLLKQFQIIEKGYSEFKPADINIFINTPPQTIRARREMDDASFEKIKSRYSRVSKYMENQNHYIEIDGTKTLDEVVLEVKKLIFDRL